MTERGLPIVDGAPACPFVAFEDDRDARAASPDHRHRCYAEVRPAPRALAHQEAYCLSSAFPVCPTFQDWARREAARARADAPSEGGGDTAVAAQGRNPPRPWSAPPPWAGEPGAQRAGGLSGSMADRLAAGESIVGAEPAAAAATTAAAAAGLAAGAAASLPGSSSEPHAVAGGDPGGAAARDAGERRAQPAPMARPAAPPKSRRPPMPIDPDAPSWERPRRIEAYPSLRARVGLPPINPPPLLVGVVALALASVAVFLLPGLIGLGGPDPSTSPGASTVASAGPSASAEPTPTPVPTQQIYIVAPGDTLSGIAQRFGMSLETLRAANPQIVNVDEIKIGDEIIIPVTIPTQIPDAGSPSSSVSAP